MMVVNQKFIKGPKPYALHGLSPCVGAACGSTSPVKMASFPFHRHLRPAIRLRPAFRPLCRLCVVAYAPHPVEVTIVISLQV